MTQWAQTSIFNAIQSLAAQGDARLANDLRRISEFVSSSEVNLLRFPESEALQMQIAEAKSVDALNNVLRNLCEAFSLQNATFHVVREGTQNFYGSKVITTYPASWVNDYVSKNYHCIDPIIQACLNCEKSFFWNELGVSDDMTRLFMQEATAAGVGSVGYTCVVDTDAKDRFALSVTSNELCDAFDARIEELAHDLAVLASTMSKAFVDIATGGRQKIDELAPDMLRYLRAAATGAAPEQLERMQFAYGSAKTLEKSICAMFRTRTVTEAVVIAARIGWLGSTPLDKSEIVTLETL